MIDYPGQETDRPTVPGIPDDIAYLGGTMQTIAHWMKKVYDALRRQESPNPTVINLDAGVVWQSTARFRCQTLVFSGGAAADIIGLKVGNAVTRRWVQGNTSAPVPLPIIIQEGQDVTVVDITTPATTASLLAYMVAYVEVEDQP